MNSYETPELSESCDLYRKIDEQADRICELEARAEAAEAEAKELRDKAIRFDLDQLGIEHREREAVELVDLRAEVKRLSDALDKQALLTAAFNEDADIAKAKLRAVEKLPARWHEVRNRLPSYRVPIETCTEELEAALRG